jgi:hypothetical protein
MFAYRCRYFLVPLGEKVLITTWFLPQRRFRDRIPVAARFSAPVQNGPRAHSASCTMGTISFPGVNSGWGVTLTPHTSYCRGQERVQLCFYSPMSRTAGTEPHCLYYKGAHYHTFLPYPKEETGTADITVVKVLR